jgi:hypothetical protein
MGRRLKSSICSAADPLESARETLHPDDAVLCRNEDRRLRSGDAPEMFATRSAQMQRGVRENAPPGFPSSDSNVFLCRTGPFAVNPGRIARGDPVTTRLVSPMIESSGALHPAMPRNTVSRRRDMRQVTISLPELALVAGTRVAAGLGLGLLLANVLNAQQRRAIGGTLLAVGIVTTFPLLLDVFGKSTSIPPDAT